MPPQAAILTYHSQNIRGSSSASNDHAALREDLERLHAEGIRIIPLDRLLDRLDGREEGPSEPTVALTFDDGCDFDVRDLDYPGFGMQRSFLNILQDFIERNGADAQAGLHATSFVIASPEARHVIDRKSLFGKSWISDDWWAECAVHGLIGIGNHGWDHNHPDLLQGQHGSGGFTTIDTYQQCEQQVIRAAEFIAGKTGDWPEFFAYPFGESSSYIREDFFPKQAGRHRCRAALSTDPGFVTNDSDRWNLPRFVCGRDWRNPDELLRLLKVLKGSE